MFTFLAASKRILNGEIPHLDFISVRPAGSAYFHIFEILIYGDYLYYFSRYFVWIQFSLISFVWVEITNKIFLIKQDYLVKFIFYVTSLMICAHTFPIMSHATIDGIFFTSIGIYFITIKKSKSVYLGYFILGFAPLFKQSFIFLPFVTSKISTLSFCAVLFRSPK